MKTFALATKIAHAFGMYPLAQQLRIWHDHHSVRGKKQFDNLKRFYSQFISEGSLCFDIGANVGDVTEAFLALGSRVISVEPQTLCIRALQKRYQTDPRVSIVGKAVAEKTGNTELYICEYNSGISTMSPRWIKQSRYGNLFKWNKTVSIETVTLDSLIDSYGLPRFCKIDVEGFERQVLSGLTHSIPFISFEFRFEMIDEVETCLKLLSNLGPATFNYTLHGSMDFINNDWVAAGEFQDALRMKTTPTISGDIYVKYGTV
jgi:FkbM family methyltransferase